MNPKARQSAVLLSSDERAFLDQVPIDGRARANGPIRRTLGWDEAKYESIKIALIEKEILARAPGRGGAVKRRAVVAAVAADPEYSKLKTWSSDEREFFKLVPTSGDSIGNKRLREALGWEDARYWQVRARLEKRKVISKGRGRGGSVYRLQTDEITLGKRDGDLGVGADEWPEGAEEEAKAETALYGPFEEFLGRRVRDELGLSKFVIERTAFAGRKKTGGKWTRPDFTLVYRPEFKNLPDRFVEAHSYEIKLPTDAISGVYEATAHSRNVHRAYLAVFIGDNVEWVDTNEHDRVKSECERLGIGFIRFEDSEDFDTYELILEATRESPEHGDIDDFLEKQLSGESRRKIQSWFK